MPAPYTGLLFFPVVLVGACVLSLCAAVCWPRPARAVADDALWTPSQPSRRSDPTVADCQLELKAQECLANDPQLGGIDLGVTAHGCIVTVWGPAPAEALAKRAELLLRRLDGVADVVNQIHVQTREERQALAPPPQPLAPRPDSTGPPAGAGADDLADRRTEAPASSGASTPASAVPVANVPRQTALKPPVQLLAPVPVANDAAALVALVDKALRSSGRFAGVRAEISSGVVRLRGGVPAASDVFDLARFISQIPGVQRVILDGLTAADADADK